MNKNIVALVSLVGCLYSCNFKEAGMRKITIDSLREELKIHNEMAFAMAEIGTYIDSIDFSRNALRTNGLETANYESYVARMRDINQYVRKTERKLYALEKTARKSNVRAYEAVIKKLRAELEIRNHELAAIQEQANLYYHENENLVNTVSIQKTEIQDKLNQIKSKQEEARQLQAQVAQLLTQSKLDEGEAYFARAEAVEETANRTRFAPRKKVNTRKQAIELYKLALSLGKNEASARISNLEKKL